MNNIIIYGNGSVAELTYARLIASKRYNVVGFVVDVQYINKLTIFKLPVVAFDDITTIFPPTEVIAIMAIGYVKLNQIRAERFRQMKELGYSFTTYISPSAIISPTANIGEGCSIGDAAIIGPYVNIGENVRIGTRCVISHHSVIGSHNFFAVNAVAAGNVITKSYVIIGASATLLDGMQIGQRCVIGAGTTISTNTPDDSVWVAPSAEKLPITSDRLPSIN